MNSKTAVLVIDMLNDFLYGKLKCERCQRIIPDVKKMIDRAHKKNLPVVYVCDRHIKTDREFEKWPPHAIEGTEGAEIIDELKPRKGDYVVPKRRYSGFFETSLDLLLRELNVNEIILSGILTDICVLHTAADAFFRGYRISIPRECTEALSDRAKDYAFKFMEEMYGANIVSLDELL
ncbi:MAG: cysteine hydrolase family protein [Candidatus Njordarchaeota archaeon]